MITNQRIVNFVKLLADQSIDPDQKVEHAKYSKDDGIAIRAGFAPAVYSELSPPSVGRRFQIRRSRQGPARR